MWLLGLVGKWVNIEPSSHQIYSNVEPGSWQISMILVNLYVFMPSGSCPRNISVVANPIRYTVSGDHAGLYHGDCLGTDLQFIVQ